MYILIDRQCGKPAFMIDHMPEYGEAFMAKSAVLLDGTKPEDGKPVICSSCKRHMYISDLDISMIIQVRDEIDECE